MLHPLIYKMFPTYPRDIGTFRQKASSFDDVHKFIVRTNGVSDCFIGLYNKRQTVDKLFFDIDSSLGYTHSIETASKLYTYLQEKNYSPIALNSGKKGFHIYVPLVPSRNTDAKNLLRRASEYIIDDALGTDTEHIDYSVVGDIRQLCRLINTLRPPKNLSWCVLLPEDWTTLSVRDIVALTKEPNYIDVQWNPKHKLVDLEMKDEVAESAQTSHVFNGSSISVGLSVIQNILKLALKPCLYEAIQQHNPRHAIRGAATAELLDKYSPEDVAWIFSQLGWMDYNHKTTLSYIKSWIGGRPWGCNKLRSSGIDCKNCELMVTQ